MADTYSFVGDAINDFIKENSGRITEDVLGQAEELTGDGAASDDSFDRQNKLRDELIEKWDGKMQEEVLEDSSVVLGDFDLLAALCADDNAVRDFIDNYVDPDDVREFFEDNIRHFGADGGFELEVSNFVDEAMDTVRR